MKNNILKNNISRNNSLRNNSLRKFILILILAILSLRIMCFAVTADVKNISNDKYFEYTHNALKNAKKSIYVTMYSITLNNTLNNSKSEILILLNDLISAHKKGVVVKVILDKSISFNKNSRNDNKNKTAFEYLKQNSIDVNYDTKATITHAKCIIIDKELVISGSTNWSISALSKNNEISFAIKSKTISKEILEQIKDINIDSSIANNYVKKYFYLNSEIAFLHLNKIAVNKSNFAWQLYLYFITQYEFDKEIVLDFDTLIKYLGIENNDVPSHQRLNVRRTLKKLDKKYKLISYLNPANTKENPRIVLKSFNNKNNRIAIPETFWSYGWNKRLSLGAQYCYFINLAESGSNHREWRLNIPNIMKKYNVGKQIVCNGMRKLRHWNILKIQYGEKEKNSFKHVFPNTYSLKRLYSLEEYENNVKKLKEKYGDEKFMLAKKYAKIVYCENDLDEIETIILLISKYTNKRAFEVFDYIDKRTIDSSKRSMAYAIRMFE